jgi:hypothetical protein
MMRSPTPLLKQSLKLPSNCRNKRLTTSLCEEHYANQTKTGRSHEGKSPGISLRLPKESGRATRGVILRVSQDYTLALAPMPPSGASAVPQV